jgi:hypothetical protein
MTVLSLIAGVGVADDSLSNELNSPVDEPTVVIHELSAGIPARPVSRAVQESTDPLVKLVSDCREAQRRRLLSTSEHTPWQIMHGMVGLREDLLLKHGDGIVNGLEWIATGPSFQNEPWFMKTRHGGQAHPFNKPWWFEGHINQFAAILSMASVPLDQKFQTPDGPITMRDMVRNAQMTVNSKEEVTWTLWLLSRYLPPDAEWTNAKGERWSIEKIVKVEIGKPVGGPTSPCGGTHGLFALAHARNVYLRSGKPLRGVWLEAEQKIQKYIRTARMQLNSDGSLSSSFFKGREYKQDFDKRMASCGHLLEFLMMAVPQKQLSEPWLRRAIEATANDLMANRKQYVSCSPLYHATNALSIYLDRVAPYTPDELAKKNEKTKSVSQTRVLPDTPQAANKTSEIVSPAEPQSSATGTSAAPIAMPPAGAESTAPAATETKTATPQSSDSSPSATPQEATTLPATESPKSPESLDVPDSGASPSPSIESPPAPIGDASDAQSLMTVYTLMDMLIGTALESSETAPSDSEPIAVEPVQSAPQPVPLSADVAAPVNNQEGAFEASTTASKTIDIVVTPATGGASTQPDADAAGICEPQAVDTPAGLSAPDKPDSPTDDAPQRGSWKATPLERRKPITVTPRPKSV